MFGFFSKEKREERRRLRELHGFVKTFGTLERLEQSGLLGFDKKNRRLFIEQPLAVVMMAGGAEKWQTFLQNCFLWLYHRQCTEAWESFILKEELKAVRRTAKRFPLMTRRDIERVKRARRDEVLQSDVQPPKVEPFEFFIIRETAPVVQPTEQQEEGRTTAADATDTVAGGQAVPGGEIMAVGWYEPIKEEVEMAAWDEVQAFLSPKG